MLDDAIRQIKVAELSAQRRLYLLAAAQLEVAAVILRIVHARENALPEAIFPGDPFP